MLAATMPLVARIMVQHGGGGPPTGPGMASQGDSGGDDKETKTIRKKTLAVTKELVKGGRSHIAKNLGIQVTKEWLTQRDGKVRDAHIAVDKQEVGENENFSVAGYSMKYPGDSSNGAPASLICNCRCSIIYHEKKV